MKNILVQFLQWYYEKPNPLEEDNQIVDDFLKDHWRIKDIIKDAYHAGQANGRRNEAGVEGLVKFEDWLNMFFLK